MHFPWILILSAAIANVSAVPFTFPLPDGFPNPDPYNLDIISKKAGGYLPNVELPKIIKEAAVPTLQILALNEFFEVAFFTELLANVTNNVPGYDAESIAPLDRQYAIDTITTIANQEKLHALSINDILEAAGYDRIQPCQYDFPVTTLRQAALLAQTYGGLILGSVPEAQGIFAADGGEESKLVAPFGSVLAQEGQQVGFYRFAQQKTASATPFATGGYPSFHFTALQQLIVPNSCPLPLSAINLTTFEPLTIINTPEAKNMTLEFAVPGCIHSNNSVLYITGQRLPVIVSISNVTAKGGMNHFTADFPFEANFANGLIIATVIKEGGKLDSYEAVAEATVYGPGLIEIN